MPLPPIALPADERTTALDAIVGILRRDPFLKACGTTWSSWQDDSADDAMPNAEATLPSVTITARAAPSSWSHSAPGFHRSDMLLDLDIELDGTDQRAGMKFWRAIEKALLPIDSPAAEARRQQLLDGGISGIEIVQPGYGIGSRPSEDGTQASRGTIRLEMYITTPGV